MNSGSSAIVTVAFGHSTEHLDHTFASFGDKNPGIPLHAFVIGERLPNSRIAQVTYHLIASSPDFSHPLREVYFRRHELIDELGADHVLVVDSYDVLCMQPLPEFSAILAGFAVAAATEHMGSRYVLGQGYTANYLNGGVTFWNVARSREMRKEIGRRGRAHFRIPADDQMVINEVVQTKYFDQVRILPCQFNYRAYLNKRQRGWPTVDHLDGVLIYHNAACIEEAKRLPGVKPRAHLPDLPSDQAPLDARQQFWRRFRQRFVPHVIK